MVEQLHANELFDLFSNFCSGSAVLCKLNGIHMDHDALLWRLKRVSGVRLFTRRSGNPLCLLLVSPGRPRREWYTSLNFYAVLHEEGSWFN